MTPTGTLFANARMDTLYNGCDADLQDPCAVRIDGDQIRVEYEFDGERTVYLGKALAPGHYRLQTEDSRGHATLHQFPGSLTMEGSWVEEGERGMWRIELHEPASA